MKVSDYIVEFLIERGITDVFGYPGGMVTHLMDSFYKYRNKIMAHVNYNEQGSSFCACGYAQVTHKPGVAYATSGPGATNMMTGIANAYFDSIPCVFITGQVNTYESKDGLKVRQKGFQETDIISLVKSITKYSVKIIDEKMIRYELEKAFYISKINRPGPVVLDIPMNIQRAEIVPEKLEKFVPENIDKNNSLSEIKKVLEDCINISKKPVLLIGHGIELSDTTEEFYKLSEKLDIPIVSSMLGRNSAISKNYYGFVGAYGNRWANFIISNSDLIISIGSRIDCRQTGSNLKVFATDAKLIRIDVDRDEFSNKIKNDEIDIECDLKNLIPFLSKNIAIKKDFSTWLNTCNTLKEKLYKIDSSDELQFMNKLSEIVPSNVIITTDVGQNQIWVAQGFNMKSNQKILFSGGHGSMGYSLPAAIGAYYGSKKNVVCFNGDGGLQMNIQELQFIDREKIPIKIFLINNHSLGMIRHFQEMYFNSCFMQTKKELGFTDPDFKKIADAYGIRYKCISVKDDCSTLSEWMKDDKACFIEVNCNDTTYVLPKLAMGKPIHDQEPLLDRELFNELMELCKL